MDMKSVECKIMHVIVEVSWDYHVYFAWNDPLGKVGRLISYYMQSSLIAVTWFLQHQLCFLPHLFDSGFSVFLAAYSSLSWWVIWTMFPMLNKVSFQLLSRIVAAGRNVTAMRSSKASSGEMLQQWFDLMFKHHVQLSVHSHEPCSYQGISTSEDPKKIISS